MGTLARGSISSRLALTCGGHGFLSARIGTAYGRRNVFCTPSRKKIVRYCTKYSLAYASEINYQNHRSGNGCNVRTFFSAGVMRMLGHLMLFLNFVHSTTRCIGTSLIHLV
ncbi:hypothetical protein EV356DRAFT_238802 [Viridothelium virens]|uniref:Uncharacterized protein n=1 Tax=Viridothelium virens TaxID=1048519 RepID=A0A6A6H4C9_VIRVR|nr:hypothetical protein EV356DRAFT_238802 [Viridothelium virens]